MPSIVPIARRSTTGHIAGIRYLSGREIFAGENPMLAEFVSHPDNAAAWPTPEMALQAAETLAEAFSIRNFSAIRLFTRPAPENQ
jgi:hypothetical protein